MVSVTFCYGHLKPIETITKEWPSSESCLAISSTLPVYKVRSGSGNPST